MQRLTLPKLAERLGDFTPKTYFYLMKGTTLGIGALTLLTILEDPTLAPLRVSFWLATFLAVLVALVAAVRGNLLTPARHNFQDSIFPILMGTLECVLFGMLRPSSSYPNLPYYWLAAFALHAGLGSLLVRNRLHQTADSDYSPELLPIVASFRTWLRRDLVATTAVCAACSVCFIAWLTWWRQAGWFRPNYLAPLGIVLVVALLKAMADADGQRAEIAQFVVDSGATSGESEAGGS